MDILQRLIGVYEGGGKLNFLDLVCNQKSSGFENFRNYSHISYIIFLLCNVIFLANYPETLKAAYVLNASSFFQIVFKIVQVT